MGHDFPLLPWNSAGIERIAGARSKTDRFAFLAYRSRQENFTPSPTIAKTAVRLQVDEEMPDDPVTDLELANHRVARMVKD
jgi:DMSO/TMAO reductase YedYZ molybdopterin-dependent catalytic subunit